MQDNKKLTIVDINAGLGERSFAFSQADFRVLAMTEPDKDSIKVCQSVLQNVPIIKKPLHEITPEEIPESDILVGTFMHFSPVKSSNYVKWNEILGKIILRNAPKIILFQVPPALIGRNDFEFLDYATRRRYSFSYKTFNDCEYSGFPVTGVQTYIIAIRNDLPTDFFLFPSQKYSFFERTLLLEDEEKIEDWYRSSIKPEYTANKKYTEKKYYSRMYTSTLTESKRIYIAPPIRETFICDSIGLRRFTHNEYAYLKGLTYYNFNAVSNKISYYRKIMYASNLYILNPIIDIIGKYIEKLQNVSVRPSDFPSKDELDKPQKQKRKEKNSSKDIIFKPQNSLSSIHITKLKGLKNLDIDFGKNLTAIMGVNGVGKSTILHALACVFTPIEAGENYKFNFFFTPTPDASWRNSHFSITYFDEKRQKEITREYKKNADRWSPAYSSRPLRDIFYLGIDSGLPEIERERQTSYIDYHTKASEDCLSSRIIRDASIILNKDYKELTDHTAKRKKLFGVRTNSGIIYSSLSMGAGEQRVFKILSVLYHAAPYTMVLIDEIDLLLHPSALVNLIRKLSEIATNKNLQIIFTTHSPIMSELKDVVDIRYLRNTNEKTLVYDAITPDIIYDLSQKTEHLIDIYVEDDLAKAITSKILSEMKLLRYCRIQNIGSIQNAFTIAAAIVIDGRTADNVLIITDGDLYRTCEQKKAQIKKVLSGSESYHDEKIEKALSIITEFSLPENTPPEKYIYDMLISIDSDCEVLECAKFIQNVNDSHDWLNKIIEQMNQPREIVLQEIVALISEHPDWSKYTQNVRDKLQEKANLLNLN